MKKTDIYAGDRVLINGCIMGTVEEHMVGFKVVLDDEIVEGVNEVTLDIYADDDEDITEGLYWTADGQDMGSCMVEAVGYERRCDRCGTHDYDHIYMNAGTDLTFCSECETGSDWS